MNSLRPLIILRADTDVAKLTAAVNATVSPKAGQGLVLIAAPISGSSWIDGMLNFPDGSDHNLSAACSRSQRLADGLSSFSLWFRVEALRHVDRPAVVKYAAQFQSDLIITDRQQNMDGQLLRYLNDDTSLLTKAKVSVWLCGRASEVDAPIVAASDPDPFNPLAIENNSRVIRTAYALSQKSCPKKKIHFLAIWETPAAQLTAKARQSRDRAMHNLRSEIFRLWCRNSKDTAIDAKGNLLQVSQGVPVHITMHQGAREIAVMTLDELEPCVVVTGKPLRSALRRVFQPGMLSTFVDGPHSILTVTELSLTALTATSLASSATTPAAMSSRFRDGPMTSPASSV